MNIKKKYYYGALIVFLSIIMISLVFNNNVWGDEAFTMLTLKENFKTIIDITASDVHPPLYYLIAKIFVLIFGYSVPVVKIASVLPVILTMILGAILIEKYFSQNSVLLPTLFIILMAFAPNYLQMGYELRMYSWGLFFVTFSGLAAYKVYNEGITIKNTAVFIIVSLGAAYTHYFSLISVAIIYVLLFIALVLKNKKYIKECIIISVVTIIGYLPWFVIFLKQLQTVSSDYWISDIKFNTIVEFLKYPFNNELMNINILLGIVAIISLIVSIYNDNKNRKESIFGLVCISIFFLTVASGVILSLIIRPIFVIRYAFPATGLLWLGILIGLKQLLNGKLQWIVIFSIILLNGFYSYEDNYYKESDKGAKTVKTYIDQNSNKDDILLTDNMHLNWTVLEYYFPSHKIDLISNFDFKTMKKGQVIYYFNTNPTQETDEKIFNENNINFKVELLSNIDNIKVKIYKLIKE